MINVVQKAWSLTVWKHDQNRSETWSSASRNHDQRISRNMIIALSHVIHKPWCILFSLWHDSGLTQAYRAETMIKEDAILMKKTTNLSSRTIEPTKFVRSCVDKHLRVSHESMIKWHYDESQLTECILINSIFRIEFLFSPVSVCIVP